jgi:hypothetical protein
VLSAAPGEEIDDPRQARPGISIVSKRNGAVRGAGGAAENDVNLAASVFSFPGGLKYRGRAEGALCAGRNLGKRKIDVAPNNVAT